MAAATILSSFPQTQPLTIEVKANGFLGGLSATSFAAINKAATQLQFVPGELVYRESDQATGAYIVLRGKVKLVASSSDGKALILRIAQPGEIIGLSAALSARANDTNAEVVEPATVAYIKTQALYQLMENSGDLALRLAQQLSIEYSSLCQELSTLGLQRSAMSRLAKLLVGLLDENAGSGKVQILCHLTHEEMAQMIGTSRETVTRLLRELRDMGVACLKSNTLSISNVEKLQTLMD